MPNPLRNEPEIRFDLEPIWDCYEELSMLRAHADGVLFAIRPEDVHSWCMVNGLDDTETILETWQVIRLVDLRHRALMAETSKQEREKAKRSR